MAKKQPQAKIKQSQPSGFFKGMVSDVDPRLQPKSTYRDARNIKLINTSGNSLIHLKINYYLLYVVYLVILLTIKTLGHNFYY